jgi:spermidine/putrescine transport system ATP-binding protein
MTVLQNIMFGLNMEHMPKKLARQRAEEALIMVQLPQIANRKPSQLSGGQQQRVALARALVKEPAVLLLDEPLGALDLKLRKGMQFELKQMQQRVGITFIYVTHDQEEAMTMADRIAIMSGGKVLQVGTPREIYERPTSYFVADFIGETNFVNGELESRANNVGHVRLADDTIIQARLPDDHTVSMGKVTVPVRPERIGLIPPGREADLPTSNNLTVLPGILRQSQYIGTDTRYTVEIAGEKEIVVRVQNMDYVENYGFRDGQDVKVFWPIESTYILDH